jgi:O-antigen/teichoic acid export membrane protein
VKTGRWLRVARRTGWGISDQAFSSLTNFVLGVTVARSLGPRDLGAFGLAFATYVIGLSIEQTLASEPLLVRYSGVESHALKDAARSSSGTALIAGMLIGGVCLVIGWATSGALSQAFIALGVSLPGLLVQDSLRMIFFASRRGQHALINDVIWALVMFPALFILLSSGRGSVFWLTLAWGGAANAAAVIGTLQAGLVPHPSRTAGWLREHRDIAPRFLAEMMALSGTRQLSQFGIAASAGLVAVGAIRAAQLLLNALQILSQGIGLVALPEAVRIGRASVRPLKKMVWVICAALVATTFVWGAVLVLLPPSLGRAILGLSWHAAKDLFVPLTLVQAAGGAIAAAVIGLRALVAARRSLRARLLVSLLQVAGAIGGAAAAGALGAAWGLAIAGWVGAVVFWRQFNRAFDERLRSELAERSSRQLDEAPAELREPHGRLERGSGGMQVPILDSRHVKTRITDDR